MLETIGPLPFWDQWVHENLREPEEPYHNEVWLISGLKGVGKTDVCNRLITKAEEKGIPIEYFNPGQQIAEEYQMVTGVPLTDANVRSNILNQRYDAQMASRMIGPENSNKIQLIDSRLGGVVAAELTLAAARQGKLDYLPTSFHSVLIYADTQTRRLALLKAGVEANLEDYDSEEERNFEQYKKEVGIVNLYAPFLTIGSNNPAYSYWYDSGQDSLEKIANNIWDIMNTKSIPMLKS